MRRIICLILLTTLMIGCSSNEQVKTVESTDKEKTTEKTEEKTTEKTEEKSKEETKETDDMTDLETSCQQEIDKNPGNSDFSVYVKRLNDGKEISISSRKRQAASLIKLFIAGAVFENEETVKTQCSQEDLDTLLQNMICISDNSAANQLVQYLGNGDTDQGKKVVNEYCTANQYTNTHMGRLLLESNALDDNYTSVNDCGLFLSRVYNNEMTGAQEISNLLCGQQRVSKIPAGIPDTVKVGNKTGELDTVENDVAIVFLENNPYILCVQSENLTSPAQARETIVEISKIVYEYMLKE